MLSRRAVLEEERKEQRQEILDRLQPGLVVEGVISNIVDFGAFVDLNGIDGLIHISELSWSHVNHPSEVVAIGDEVQVKVLDIDRDRQRISLGLKQTQEDPWQRVVSMYNVGDELEGEVTKVVTFGAFVEILDGVEGLVHISELAPYHVENPREIVNPGDEIKVKILEIDSERRRLSLSAKRVEDQILQPPRGRRRRPTTRRGRRRPRRRARARAERGRLRRRRRRGARRRVDDAEPRRASRPCAPPRRRSLPRRPPTPRRAEVDVEDDARRGEAAHGRGRPRPRPTRPTPPAEEPAPRTPRRPTRPTSRPAVHRGGRRPTADADGGRRARRTSRAAATTRR